MTFFSPFFSFFLFFYGMWQMGWTYLSFFFLRQYLRGTLCCLFVCFSREGMDRRRYEMRRVVWVGVVRGGGGGRVEWRGGGWGGG